MCVVQGKPDLASFSLLSLSISFFFISSSYCYSFFLLVVVAVFSSFFFFWCVASNGRTGCIRFSLPRSPPLPSGHTCRTNRRTAGLWVCSLFLCLCPLYLSLLFLLGARSPTHADRDKSPLLSGLLKFLFYFFIAFFISLFYTHNITLTAARNRSLSLFLFFSLPFISVVAVAVVVFLYIGTVARAEMALLSIRISGSSLSQLIYTFYFVWLLVKYLS